MMAWYLSSSIANSLLINLVCCKLFIFTVYILCRSLCTDEHAHVKPKSVFENLDLKEKSTMTFLFGPAHLTVSSHMVDCINKFVVCAQNHDYEPYSKPKTGN